MNSILILLSLWMAIYALVRPRGGPYRWPRDGAREHRPYPGAAIGHDDHACDAVKQLDKQRFLAWEAPDIPVPGCTNKESCTCRYVCYPDRRVEGGDRRSYFCDVSRPENLERREGRERRRVSFEELEAGTDRFGLGELVSDMAPEELAADTSGEEFGPDGARHYAWEGQEWSSAGRAARRAFAWRDVIGKPDRH